MPSVRELVKITRALADSSRVRVLLALRRRELCVCQIVELLRLAPSTISKHLSILHQAGLILSRKDERWVYYRLPGRDAPRVVRRAIHWVHGSLARSPDAGADARALKRILHFKPSQLCQRQRH
ncbi:MAG TPA: metalloregulator ArsR/SmtB family transcription factor [Candidatus Acidoferrales bacterium]|nr:metalloregulator ArsR/SmtB family transcription factor [Candidatus Acidoferrales bacterium]